MVDFESNYKIMVLWHANPIPFTPPDIYKNQTLGILEDYNNCENIDYSFTFPRGEFDLLDLLNKKNISKPDVLFICMDATTPFLPRNLDKVCRNIFLCLGDTHHLPNPITRLLQYVNSEKFDGIIFTNNVRHSHWFKLVSTAEHFFEPALFAINFHSPTSDRINTDIQDTPVFYGQLGQHHPRRIRLLQPLLNSNKIKHISGLNSILANKLINSSSCINVTLNSDLNSRIFEIAQTGCLQIIDLISPYNGLGSVLIPEYNCISFSTENELNDIIINKNLNKKKYIDISNNLKNDYFNFWGIHKIRERLNFTSLGQSIKLNKPPIDKGRFQYDNLAPLIDRLFVYETLLELHRLNEFILVYSDSKSSDVFYGDALDLPRLKFCSKDEFFSASTAYRLYISEDLAGKPKIYNITE